VVRDLAKVQAKLLRDSDGYPPWEGVGQSVRADRYFAAYAWVIAFEKLADINGKIHRSADETSNEQL
jgi:hypothetical protein